jgi:ribosomal subunit interface protein
MKIDIQSKELKLGQTFKHNIKVKIRRLFQHNSDAINRINITVADINGPKGGEDKVCKINVSVGGGPNILVSAREASAYKAVTQAIKRASATLNRQRQKARNIKHISLSGLSQNDVMAEA